MEIWSLLQSTFLFWNFFIFEASYEECDVTLFTDVKTIIKIWIIEWYKSNRRHIHTPRGIQQQQFKII